MERVRGNRYAKLVSTAPIRSPESGQILSIAADAFLIPKELVITQRLYQACAYLSSTTLSVEEIAGKVGYENLGFFYQKFQSVYGLTPAMYRQARGLTQRGKTSHEG